MSTTNNTRVARYNTAAEHCLVEHRALTHIKSALRVTLDWKAPEVGVPRKMSSVRFTLQSFRRHLERLMNLEEQDGYLVIVAECKPHWSPQVESLRAEHDQIRAALRDLDPEIQSLPPHDQDCLNRVCREINTLLRRIDRHNKRESRLLQDALTLDEGGQG